MAVAEGMKDFFVSYTGADRRWAEWVAWVLEEAGYTVVLQAWDFRPGSNFVLAMQQAAEQAERTIAILSPDFLASRFTAPEWAAAFAKDPTGALGLLLPVRVCQCEPKGLLPQITYIDLLGIDDKDAARDRLLAGVKRERAKPFAEPTFPGSAAPLRRREIIQEPRFPGALPPVWNLPHRNPHFTGREELFEQLHRNLTAGTATALTQTAAIHGLGGVGKTQLAMEYAYRFKDDYDVAWWLRAEDAALLAGDCTALARALDLPEKEAREQASVIEAVRRWLEGHGRWLLVYDNAEDPKVVRDALPRAPTGHVLITSRNPAWGNIAQALPLDRWPRKESVRFLRERNGKADDRAADRVAEALGDLPLALEQAAAYCEQTGTTLTDYADLLEQGYGAELWREPRDLERTVAAVWEVSFSRVQADSPAAAALLTLCAFLAPDNIPLDAVRDGAAALPEPLQGVAARPVAFNSTVGALLRYSLARRDGDALSVHRLVQAVTRDRLPAEERRRWVERAAALVNAALPSFPHSAFDAGVAALYDRFLPHALAAAEHAEGQGVKAVTPLFTKIVAHQSTLAGVEPGYWDIWGNHNLVHPEAKRDILAALGFSTENAVAIAASTRDLEDQSWRRGLPFVLVTREGERPKITLSLPADHVDSTLSLRIRQESGAESEFVYRPEETAVHDRRRMDGREVVRYVVALPHAFPLGYHVVCLASRPDEGMRLIVAPRKCYLPPSLEAGGRTWGISAQLYTLNRPDNWGIGDFTDLRELVDAAADIGASAISLNPLHALFLAHPEEASPYSPSTRLFLNPLYIDVEAVPEYAECLPARAARNAADAEIAACRALKEIAYHRVKAIKLTILEALYACFFRKHDAATAAGGGRSQAFERFRREQGRLLQHYALFEVLSEKFAGTPWQQWPEPYRRPDSAEVAEFARANADRIRFFEYLQWLANEQLGRAQARALERGLTVGIDLAVGVSRDGLDAWADQQVIVQDANVGSPPDPFNMLGQNWGIPPLHPLILRDKGYEPFIAMLRANMRHAGALRIDHVVGLMHVFWIPFDQPATNGAYVKYAFEDMLAILALESQRHRCLVVGEDLGMAPLGFRECMTEANVLSYQVLYFEKDRNRFKAPAEYPKLALACVTTPDLATLVGFWQGSDLELKRRLHLYPSDEAWHFDERARRWDKTLLLRALAHEGLLPDGIDPEDANGAPISPALIAAVHGYLARSPALILMVQIDDLMQEAEQINLPGTVFERPNWRRRLSMRVDQLPALPVMQALKATLGDRSAG